MSAFSFNGSALKKLSQELGKLPKLIEQAEAATLNNMAFRFKEDAAASIIENYTARRPDFIKRQMRVTKATTNNMTAIAGSVGDGKNFTGFIEFLGEPDLRERAPTMFARGDNPANIMPKSMRLTPDQNFPEVSDAGEVGSVLAMLHRSQGAKAGVIIRAAGWTPGLYKFTGKPKGMGRTAKERLPVRLVQKLDKPKKQTRKFDWIAAGLAGITDDFVNNVHIKNLDFLAKKMMEKVFK
jgi:hypothetical protein